MAGVRPGTIRREDAEPHPESRATREKRRRRDAIRDAALELFASQGYANTTVAQIAQRAKVSERTFYYHFGSKEEAIFADNLVFNEGLERCIAEQSAKRPDFDVVLDAFVHFFESPERTPQVVRDTVKLLRQAAAASPTVFGRYQRNQQENCRFVALLLARRRGLDAPDAEASTVATITYALLHMALDQWVAEDGPTMPDLLVAQFAIARSAIGGPPRTTAAAGAARTASRR